MKTNIIGESQPVVKLKSVIERVAGTKTSILVIGESGTGKELVARSIHENSDFCKENFVPVNCGAIPENLIESELFGHTRGSFTGAVADKAGLFEVANRGTLFLDEVGELPLHMQVKLLRAIQDRSFRRIGDTKDIKVDIRIIAATNRDLEEAIRKGTFREDLYYRLNVILIRTPPLRERGDDVLILAKAFIKKKAKARGGQPSPTGFTDETIQALKAYRWPGNVRELENVVERAMALESGDQISLSSLPLNVQESVKDLAVLPGSPSGGTSSKNGGGSESEVIQIPVPNFDEGPVNLEEILGRVERKFLEKALHKADGTKKKAAELLGITFRSLRYRLNKLGID